MTFDLSNALTKHPIQRVLLLASSVSLVWCVGAGSVLLPFATGQAHAELLDEFSQNDGSGEEENVVTPMEEIAPGGQDYEIPGTEPIYDQGVTVTVVVIEGNDYVSDQEIQDMLLTKPGSLYSKRRLKKDLEVLYDTGWFTENLRAVPIATKDGIKIKYILHENPLVSEVTFEGNDKLDSEDLESLFKDQINRPQNVNLINKGIEKVEEKYREEGYVLARVDDIDEPMPGKIVMTVNEGVISTIEYEGNRKTKDNVVARAMAQKEGEVYNEKTVAADMKRIFSTQAFSDVRRVVKADPEHQGEYILVMELDEKKTGAISLGGGLDTGTGVFGSLGYSDPNFLGRGQNFSTVATVGTGVIGNDSDTINRRIYQLQSNWFNPSISDDSLISMGANFNIRESGSFNVPLGIERRVGGEMNLGRPIEAVPGTSVGLGVGLESTRVSEGASANDLRERGLTPLQRQESGNLDDGTFFYLAPIVGMDTRDNRLNPMDGWLNTMGSRFAYGLGNDSYGSFSANIRRYLKITDISSLNLNAQSGTVTFGKIPQFDMFRMGGTNSVRGFEEGGVGVGEAFILGSAELRTKVPALKMLGEKYPFYDMVTLVAFTDAGQLYQRADFDRAFGRPGYGISFGAGVRVNIPGVGPIRFDYGIPIGGDIGSNVRNIHFGVGQKF